MILSEESDILKFGLYHKLVPKISSILQLVSDLSLKLQIPEICYMIWGIPNKKDILK